MVPIFESKYLVDKYFCIMISMCRPGYVYYLRMLNICIRITKCKTIIVLHCKVEFRYVVKGNYKHDYVDVKSIYSDKFMVAWKSVGISMIFSKLGYFSIEDSFFFFQKAKSSFIHYQRKSLGDTPKAPMFLKCFQRFFCDPWTPFGWFTVHADMPIQI